MQLHNCKDYGNWDKCLLTFLFMLHSHANTSIGMIPSDLLLSRNVQGLELATHRAGCSAG